MEQNLDNQWFRDFSGLELTSNTVVLKAKVTASQKNQIIKKFTTSSKHVSLVEFFGVDLSKVCKEHIGLTLQ
ncbi:hypothetical protein OUZ56_005321 [Daphnia magna]|uniref:Uncharacterized protein n=1 Tax=Daphnia magna TaxID=35525 RepID=A0ABQ9YSK0_9CRUS|nr:hypothetical protein OUZ56_005321 [Daphnia magna]